MATREGFKINYLKLYFLNKLETLNLNSGVSTRCFFGGLTATHHNEFEKKFIERILSSIRDEINELKKELNLAE